MNKKTSKRLIAIAGLVAVSLAIYSSRNIMVRSIDRQLEQRIDRSTKYRLKKWQYKVSSLFSKPEIITLETNFNDGLASVAVKSDGGNKYGYINRTGEIAIPTVFDWADNFKESYAAVEFEYKWGIIDTKGNVVTPFAFDSIRANSLNADKGYFQAVQKGKEGLIDLNGNVIIPFKFDRIISFNLQQDYVKGKIDGKEGITNTKGNIIIPFKFDRINYINHHRNLQRNYVVAEVNNKKGIIDTEGNVLLPFEFDRIGQSTPDLILAERYWTGTQPRVLGKLDRQKNFVPLTSKNSDYFSAGILVASYPDRYSDRTCIINQDGKLLVSATSLRAGKAEKINNLCRSLAGIKVNNYAVEESTEPIQGDNPFDYYFKEGLLAIPINSQYGYVNLKGELAIPQLYERASDFSSGLAMVQQGDRFGFIDRSGKIVLEAKDYLPFSGYSSFDDYNADSDCNQSYRPIYSHFENDLAIVSKIDNSAAKDSLDCINPDKIKYYFLNKQNQIVSGDLIYTTFAEATPINADLIEIKTDNGLRGVMKTNGEIVTKPNHQ